MTSMAPLQCLLPEYCQNVSHHRSSVCHTFSIIGTMLSGLTRPSTRVGFAFSSDIPCLLEMHSWDVLALTCSITDATSSSSYHHHQCRYFPAVFKAKRQLPSHRAAHIGCFSIEDYDLAGIGCHHNLMFFRR